MLSCTLKCQTVVIIKALGVLGQSVFLKLSFFIDLEASMWTLVAWEIIQVNIMNFQYMHFPNHIAIIEITRSWNDHFLYYNLFLIIIHFKCILNIFVFFKYIK